VSNILYVATGKSRVYSVYSEYTSVNIVARFWQSRAIAFIGQKQCEAQNTHQQMKHAWGDIGLVCALNLLSASYNNS
jgi:hypothetical protein